MADSKVKVKTYEENKWAFIVICLKRSAAVLRKPAEDTMRKEFDSWDYAIKNDFKSFTQGLKSGNISVRYISFQERQRRNIHDAWEVNDRNGHEMFRHKIILNKILSIHSNPRNKNIQWNSDCTNAEPFWILAKIFMPFGNKDNSFISEVDPISLFDLLKNCKLFKNMFDLDVIEELCKARHAVMHSCDQRLTSMETDYYFKHTEAFLDSSCFIGIPEVSEAKNILSTMKCRNGHLDLVAIAKLDKEVRQMFPDRHFTTEELLAGTKEFFSDFVSDGIKYLKKELERDKEKLKKLEKEEGSYKHIGRVTGASVIWGMSLAAVGAAAFTVSAPVAVPFVIAGCVVTGVAAGLGYIGGRANGGVIGWLWSITQ